MNTDYNLILSPLLLYSSLVLMDGFLSLMQSASKARRYFSSLVVECRILTCSSAIVVEHLLQCVFTGPSLRRCSLRRTCRCRPDWPTQHALQRGHCISYTIPLFRTFSIGGFNEGKAVFNFLKVITIVQGALILCRARA